MEGLPLSKFAEELSSRLDDLTAKAALIGPDRVSYLDLKVRTMLQYSHALLKLKVLTGEDAEVETKKLLKFKALIERLKPLDLKLQYVLDKLGSGYIEPDLKLRPNPLAMDKQLTVVKSKVYKPPKLQAVPYEDKSSKAARDELRLKKKLARSAFIASLKEDLGDEPVEIKPTVNRKLKALEDEQTKYEEANFTRVNLTKKDRKLRRQLATQEEDDLTGDIQSAMRLLAPNKDKLKKSLEYKRPEKRQKRRDD
jgi:U3 small nucleolar ribonucleoprotein protein LCP5/U3 small nucleolar RNA-associated protein 3